jgi:hypothetical protein
MQVFRILLDIRQLPLQRYHGHPLDVWMPEMRGLHFVLIVHVKSKWVG